MIDFRYHLVSLVSVFLALAIGIALGAGPLEGGIADQLSRQVDDLRASRNDTAGQLRTEQVARQNRDVFVSTMMPTMVAGQLPGTSVVIISLPGADGNGVAPLAQTLQSAGAKVTARIEIQDRWIDPKRSADRQRLLNAEVTHPPGETPSAAASSGTGQSGQNADLAALLARLVVTKRSLFTTVPDPSTSTTLTALRDAGMIAIDGDFAGRATEAVLLAPSVQPAPDAGTPSPSAADDVFLQWATLARALDRAGEGSVLLGPASSAAAGGVLAAVRASPDLTKLISTVDLGTTPMGDIATVLALREQQTGGSGRYGFAGAVDGVIPAGG